MSEKPKVRAELKEFDKREIIVKPKNNNIYFNGANNLYPNECEAAILSSPTALKCYKLKSKFIAGRELKQAGQIVKYRDLKPLNNKGHNLYDIVENGAQSIAMQNGVYVWVGYGFKDGKVKPTQYEILDFAKCRLSKEDAKENAGKIFYGDFEGSKPVTDWYYPFNDLESVILAQADKDSKLRKLEQLENETSEDFAKRKIEAHRGQIAFLNLDKNLVYPLNPIHATYLDADTERRLSIFNNQQIKEGFLGKMILLFNGLDVGDEDKAKKETQKWLGETGASGIYSLFTKDADNLDSIIKAIQLHPVINDKMFEKTRFDSVDNLIGAFNILKPLVSTGDGALFGTSGDAYKQLKLIQDELTESERTALENFFYKIGIDVEIIAITAEETQETSEVTDLNIPVEVNEENLKAQAMLRGSVGGVQGILGIQQSVSDGLTDVESAITILVEIYGFTRGVSRALLGQPEEIIVEETTNKLNNFAKKVINRFKRSKNEN